MFFSAKSWKYILQNPELSMISSDKRLGFYNLISFLHNWLIFTANIGVKYHIYIYIYLFSIYTSTFFYITNKQETRSAHHSVPPSGKCIEYWSLWPRSCYFPSCHETLDWLHLFPLLWLCCFVWSLRASFYSKTQKLIHATQRNNIGSVYHPGCSWIIYEQIFQLVQAPRLICQNSP